MTKTTTLADVIIHLRDIVSPLVGGETFELVADAIYDLKPINYKLSRIVAQLRAAGYRCEAGALEDNVAFQELERLGGAGKREAIPSEATPPPELANLSDLAQELGAYDLIALREIIQTVLVYKLPGDDIEYGPGRQLRLDSDGANTILILRFPFPTNGPSLERLVLNPP
jgi:hypothetical protein